MPWQPTTIKRADQPYNTGAETVRVTTDAGPAFLKALGNRGGPHLLAAEWVGTHLAKWLGLPTFDFAILEVTDLDEIGFFRGGFAQPGPAFVTREQSGMVWSGSLDELGLLSNPEDILRLVLFDTWTRNCDRHPPDLNHRKPNRNNVFLSNEGMDDGRFQLLAMDHTHCFNCGRDLNAQLSHIDLVQDERIFGLFPEFATKIFFMDKIDLGSPLRKLAELNKAWVRDLVRTIPVEWEVDAVGSDALATLICDRAQFLREKYVELFLKNFGLILKRTI